MSNLRPYWKKHPVQMRVFAAALLPLSPVVVPVLLLVAYHKEVGAEFCYVVRQLWRALRYGKHA